MSGPPTDVRVVDGAFTGVGFWPTGATNPRSGLPMWVVVGGDLRYLSPRLGLVVIPEGFVFDGPSIPWLAQVFMPSGAMFLASAVHDYLLACTNVDKHLVDKVFLEALRERRCPAWAAWLAYRAVRTKTGRD